VTLDGGGQATFSPTPAELPIGNQVNCTVPVGVPEPGAAAVTVAVTVTGWPKTAFGEAGDEIPAVLLSLLTTWVSGIAVLPAKFASPG
jgi:hypothetical protein